MSIRSTASSGNFKSILFSLILVSLAATLCGLGEARAEQVTLAWDPNSEPDLAGYKIHLGTASNAYSSVIDVGSETTYTVTNLTRGTTYYFAVTAYNTQGMESDYSNEVDKTMVRQYQLTVGKRGSGLGSVSGEGINCGDDCRGIYDEGSQVTLNAIPAAGSIFTGWSGDDCSGLGECVLTMWSDKDLYAGLVSQSNSGAKKKRSVQIAGRTGTDDPLRRAKTVAPSGEASTSYYVITRRTDRRGTASGYDSLTAGEGVLRSKYTSH